MGLDIGSTLLDGVSNLLEESSQIYIILARLLKIGHGPGIGPHL